MGSSISIDVYKYRWLPKPSTFKISDPPHLPSIFKVAMICLENGNWNKSLIEHLFYEEDAKDFLSLPVGSFDHTDVLIWH